MRFRFIWVMMGLLAVAVIAGILLGWLGSKGPTPNMQLSSAFSNSSVRQSPLPLVERSNSPSPVKTSPPVVASTQALTAVANTNLIADWEDKLDDILQGEVPEKEKAQKMLAVFSRLPEDGQTEVAQHLSNLVADEDYEPLGKLLADDKLPEAVLDVLMADVLNRPNSVKLPALLEVAKDAQHPKAEEARDLLELFLEDNYGTNWGQWQAKMDQWLKENPD